MSLKNKLTGWLSAKLVAQAGLMTIDELDEADVADLKVVARLFEVVAREPVFTDALLHAEETLAEHISDRPALSVLFRTIAASLLTQVANEFDQAGYDEDADRTRRLAAQLKPATPDKCVFYLLSACSNVKIHLLPQRVPDAVIRAILVELDTLSPRVDRANVLTAAANATFSTGNMRLLRRVLDKFSDVPLSTGYLAIRSIYEGQLTRAEGRKEEFEASIAAAGDLVSRMAGNDPAHAAVERLWRLEKANLALRNSGSYADTAVADHAAAAMHRGDWDAAVTGYEELIRGPASDHHRAAFRVFAEGARLLAGQLDDARSLMECAERLATDNIARARSMTETDALLVHLLGKAFAVEQTEPGTSAAVCIADLIGEFRTGVAIDHREHRSVASTTAAADLALVDFLTKAPSLTTMSDLVEMVPDTPVIWINLVESDEDAGAMVCTALPKSKVARTRRVRLADSGSAVFEMVGRSSEHLAAHDLEALSRELFADIPAHGPMSDRVLVVPDNHAWQLPWQRLAPSQVAELAVVPSVAAAGRMRPPSFSAHPRVIGVFDETLAGAVMELTKLSDLADRGLIDFHRVHSLGELAQRLDEDRFDMLTIAVHGSSGDGFEYQLMLPDGTRSPAALLSMRLPHAVVLGCCWSARAPLSRDTATAAVGCLVAGASTVIGGMWDVDDRTAGTLLADTYERSFTGTPLPTAFRNAFTALTPDLQVQAAGLNLFGRL